MEWTREVIRTVEGAWGQERRDHLGQLHGVLEPLAVVLSESPFGDPGTTRSLAVALGPGQDVKFIPSDTPGACTPTLVAVALKDTPGQSLPQILQQVLAHFVRCFEKTTLAVVLCDRWRPQEVEPFRPALDALRARGKRLVFLKAGRGGRVLEVVHVV